MAWQRSYGSRRNGRMKASQRIIRRIRKKWRRERQWRRKKK